jgi:hypothetical protein
MKRFVLIVIPALICGVVFTSCDSKQDNIVDSENCTIWGAYPMASIDDGKVKLSWMKPILFWTYEKDVIEPEKFDIFISENQMSNFRKLIESDRDDLYHEENYPYKYEYYTYTVDKLKNGEPYFFYVVSKKKGFKPKTSDTIMAVPNKRKDFEILMSDSRSTFCDVTVARQKNKLAYVDKFYTWDGGENCCMAVALFISNMDGSGKELIARDSYKPSWSHANDKIAFHFDWKYQVGWIPAQIALCDLETQSITQLTDGAEYSYAPHFSENGELLIFQSTKNTPDNDKEDVQLQPSNIWVINLKTLESFQVTDIFKASLRTARRPCFIDNDRFLFQGLYSRKYQLYDSSISKQHISKLFESKWNDYNPTISPDKKKIAFISDRSRTHQIWIYHFESKKYSQITPYSFNESVEPTWDKVEWLDNSTVVFSINEHQLVKQKIE